MTIRIRHALAKRARGESGFTLVEVIVSMVIVLMVMTALTYAVISSLRTIQQARQRQTATALATQELERLRALPFDTVALGVPGASVRSPNPYVTTTGGAKFAPPASILPGPITETLVLGGPSSLETAGGTGSGSGRWVDDTLDNVTYRVYTYVTGPFTTTSGSDTFNLSVIVGWTSTVWRGGHTAVERTTTYSASGCLSSATSPYAAPCQAYITTRADAAQEGLAVSNTEDPAVQPWLLGNNGVQQLQLAFPATGAAFNVEQTAAGSANAITTSSLVQGVAGTTTTGGQSAKAAVDSDPTSPANQSMSVTSPAQSPATVTLNNGAGVNSPGTLTLTQGGSDVGHARAAVSADTTICQGLTSNPSLDTGDPMRPCASSDVQPGGTGSTLTYTSPLGGANVSLAVFAPNGQSRSVSGIFGKASGTTCSGTVVPSGSAVDCGYAASQRAVGTAYFPVTPVGGTAYPAPAVAWDDGTGVTPTLDPGASLNSAIGLWRLSGLTESAWAEEGNGARIPTTSMYSRAGTLDVWTGTAGNGGYTTVNLADFSTPASASLPASQTWTIFPTQIQYSPEITLRYSGAVTVQRPKIVSSPAFTSSRNVAVQCQASACHTTVDGSSGVVATVDVEVLVNGAHWTSFAVVTDLGGLTADASYKAAQNAS